MINKLAEIGKINETIFDKACDSGGHAQSDALILVGCLGLYIEVVIKAVVANIAYRKIFGQGISHFPVYKRWLRGREESGTHRVVRIRLSRRLAHDRGGLV